MARNLATMDVFVAWDGDHIGRQVGRMSLEDDVEGLRRISQAIDHGNLIWRSWAESTGGSLVSYGGDEGRAQIPADHLDELPRIRRQYQEAVGAAVSVGVGIKLSDADKALFVAKLRGGNRVLIYTPEMEDELAEATRHPQTEADKLSDEYLTKEEAGSSHAAARNVTQEAAATIGPGQEVAHLVGKNRGAHAGFAGHKQPSQPGTQKPVPTQRDHSEVQSVQQTIQQANDSAPDAPPTGGPSDLESQFHGHAQDQESKDQAEASQNDQAMQQLKAQVVQVLQQVKEQAPVIAEMQGRAPDAYAAVMNMASAMIMLAREVTQAEPRPEPDPEQIAPQAMGKSEGEPVRPHNGLQSEAGYVYHATNEENARSIASEGLQVHHPWEGTDQDVWPDGSTQKRNYHSPKANVVWGFAPEHGHPVILRTHTQNHPFKTERGTGDMYSTKPISPLHMEILLHPNTWTPLASWAGVAKGENTAAIPGTPNHVHLNLPVGTQVGNKVKVQHDDGSTGFKEMGSGQVLSQDPTGHPASSREPNAR